MSGGEISVYSGGRSAQEYRSIASYGYVHTETETSSSQTDEYEEEYGYIWQEEPIEFILGGQAIYFPAKNELSVSVMNKYGSSAEQSANTSITYYYDSTHTKTVSGTGILDISDIQNEYETETVFLGQTTTALSNGSTTNPISINGSSVTAVSGNSVAYNSKQYVYDGSKWNEDPLSIQSFQITIAPYNLNKWNYGPRTKANLATGNVGTRTNSNLSLPVNTVFRSSDSYKIVNYLTDDLDYTLKGKFTVTADRPYQMSTANKKTVYPYAKKFDSRPYIVLNAYASNVTYGTLESSAWESGTIREFDGSTVAGNTRLRTKTYFRAQSSNVSGFTHAFYAVAIYGYQFCVHAYNSSGGYIGCLTDDGYKKATSAKSSLNNVKWLTYFDLRNPGNGIYYYKFVLRNGANVKAKLTAAANYMHCFFVTGSSDTFYHLYQGYVDAKDSNKTSFSMSQDISRTFRKTANNTKDLYLHTDFYAPNPKKWVASNSKYTSYLSYKWSFGSDKASERLVVRPKNSTSTEEGFGQTVRSIMLPDYAEVNVYAADAERFFRKVRLSKVEKGELNRFGTLEVKAEFECLSPWKEPVSGYVVHGSATDISKNAFNSNIITIESTSLTSSPCELIIAPQTGSTFVNPQWQHYVNGVLVAQGKFNGTLKTNQTATISGTSTTYNEALFINSDPAEHGVYVRKIDTGSTIEEDTFTILATDDKYSSLDFTKDNFIYIRHGINTIYVKDDGTRTTVDIRLRGNIYHESV